jgi:putative salt-induced outer membrane protein YdiY
MRETTISCSASIGRLLLLAATVTFALPFHARAQESAPPTVIEPAPAQIPPPEPPPKAWTTTAGVGLAVTSGNSDTSTYNMNYGFTYDPKTRNVVKSDGLLIRGKTEGILSSDRLSLNVRDEFRINGRVFVFAQNQYLRDTFKEIDYLLAPTGGIGYKLVDLEKSKLSIDAGIGNVWEKNPELPIRSSGAMTLDQTFFQAISSTTLTQSFSGLWKVDDLDDALYRIGAGIAVSMSARTQIKIEWLDTFKNRPPAGVEKSDVSVIMAFVFKN